VNHRWLGGTLLNFSQVKKSLTRLLHYEDILAKAEANPFYTKKELNLFKKTVDKLEKTVGGIRKLSLPIGAVVIVDVNKEQSAVKEAASMGVPIVGLVDTNSDPSLVDYVIPANDDSPQSISLLLNYLSEAVERGREIAAKKGKTTENAPVAATTIETEVVAPGLADLDSDI
jgi:small subunit ribosomal protein S2